MRLPVRRNRHANAISPGNAELPLNPLATGRSLEVERRQDRVEPSEGASRHSATERRPAPNQDVMRPPVHRNGHFNADSPRNTELPLDRRGIGRPTEILRRQDLVEASREALYRQKYGSAMSLRDAEREVARGKGRQKRTLPPDEPCGDHAKRARRLAPSPS
jgi:hypothetical protein